MFMAKQPESFNVLLCLFYQLRFLQIPVILHHKIIEELGSYISPVPFALG